MRFSAPRSLSPSPIRRNQRSRSTFGLQSDSDDDSENCFSSSESESDTESTTSTSSSDLSQVTNPAVKRFRSKAERRHIDDTVAAIRLRARHHDPYEEWEKETRKDAFRTARKDLTNTQSQLRDEQERIRLSEQKRLAAAHVQQMTEVAQELNAVKLQLQSDQGKLKDKWKARERMLWEGIESVIKLEEDKVKVRLEAERNAREAEEKRLQEVELERKLVEEKRKQEEETKQAQEAAKRKEENEVREREAIRQATEKAEELKRKEREKTTKIEEDQRRDFGLTSPSLDWSQARQTLVALKTTALKSVKSDSQMKSEWGRWRRQITPKIGQLTNDEQAIARISGQLIGILNPPGGSPHHKLIYTALLSSLAKAILLQAETEVTAEKRSAIPIARVAFNLLETLEGFPEVFFARLVQRTGGWIIPIIAPDQDYDGRPWASTAERMKTMGFRKSENSDDLEGPNEHMIRIGGIMRVYFHILKITPRQRPLSPMFQLPRYWMWFARMIGDKRLSQSPVAPQLIYTGLDVMGSDARDIWGHQWIKILSLLYDAVVFGLDPDSSIGGESGEGMAARVRVQIEIERIMGGVKT